uniref:DUF223 domain-containing protein n=1 Tax=Brassica campestris TaxID=3711 RepID=M4F2N4_BRACM
MLQFVNSSSKNLKVVQLFKVYDAIGDYQTSSHPYKIGFFHATFVAKPNDFPSEVPEKYLADYTEIPGGKADNNRLVDVIGQIVNFGSIENKMIKGKDNMRLLIELRDQNIDSLTLLDPGFLTQWAMDYRGFSIKKVFISLLSQIHANLCWLIEQSVIVINMTNVTLRDKGEPRAINFSHMEKENYMDDMENGQVIGALQDMDIGNQMA